MISFDDVSISYGNGLPVVHRTSFTIPDGDLCLVVGRTGTGKSTLLHAMNGLVPHLIPAQVSGRIRVGGRDTRHHRPRDLADLVGFVPQNPLDGFVTDRVEDEIAYGMEQLGLSPGTMRKRVEETLDLMNIAPLRRRPLADLSGGQQQRVAIAAVLAAQPRVVVLDEPTSALDPTAAQDVLAAITTLVHDVGLTVVLAEHRLERVMQAADSVLWLPGDGSVRLGAAREVLREADVVPPLAELAQHLGWAEVPLSVREARRRLAASHQAALPRAAAPRPTPTASGGDHDGVASMERLRVSYGDLVAVRDITARFHTGEVTALMGRNGAGKSSLLWAMAGAAPSTGSLHVRGVDPRTQPASQSARVISLVPQTASDLLYLPTVRQECAQADAESGSSPGSTAARLTGLGLAVDPGQNPRDLSEGQRLALVLAIQLAGSPTVVLLDEPTRGLDYAVKHQLAGILRQLANEGRCVIVSTHDVEFVARATDRTVLLADGEIIADSTTREVCTSSPAFAPQVAKVFFPAQALTTDDLSPIPVRL